MRLLQVQRDRYVFQLGRRDQALLFGVLKLYPVTPASHHRITRADVPAPDSANQGMLDEAIAAHTAESKKRVGQFLTNPARFSAAEDGHRLTLEREEIEWLLQVLNDVRVGSWLMLGCPDPDAGGVPEVTSGNRRYFLAMELAGHFESVLLRALDASTA